MTRAPRRLLPPTAGAVPIERLQIDNFARRLNQALLKKGWSQSQLAEKVWGRTKDHRGNDVAKGRDRISVYLAGKAFPDPHNLAKIAEALGLPISELAPDATAAAVERDRPEVALTQAPGHPELVYLVVNKLMPMTLAARIVSMIADADADKK